MQSLNNGNHVIIKSVAISILVLLLAVALDSEEVLSNSGFRHGDVFAAVGGGRVRHFRPDGTLVGTYVTSVSEGETAGMAFDSEGHLLLTHFDADQVFKFDTTGQLLGTFGEGYDESPESIVIDLQGHIYIGQADGTRDVLMFDPTGVLLQRYSPAPEVRGTDWIDLAADQKTLFYTSEGKYIKRYDLENETQLPEFNVEPLPGRNAYALRILPNGDVIVADTEVIVRLNKDGKQVAIYDAPGEDEWFAVNLDPDGETFWSGDISTGQVYRFDIESGEVLSTWNTDAVDGLGGLAIYGEIRVAQAPTPTPTSTFTATPSPTPTFTPTITPTPTFTATPTPTPTLTPTSTPTPTPTFTSTPTFTPSPTPTTTPTITPIPTPIPPIWARPIDDTRIPVGTLLLLPLLALLLLLAIIWRRSHGGSPRAARQKPRHRGGPSSTSPPGMGGGRPRPPGGKTITHGKGKKKRK